MIQEKYNRRIYDEGTEESILNYSHMRSNALSPLRISKDDSVLIMEPDSEAVVEWLQEKTEKIAIGQGGQLDKIKDKFNIIINLGNLTETPLALKGLLSESGRLVYALPQKDKLVDFTKRLLTEAGFSTIDTYRLWPDYLFTTEIYAEDYIGGGAGDYLLVAR